MIEENYGLKQVAIKARCFLASGKVNDHAFQKNISKQTDELNIRISEVPRT